jgi:hypothetical protein
MADHFRMAKQFTYWQGREKQYLLLDKNDPRVSPVKSIQKLLDSATFFNITNVARTLIHGQEIELAELPSVKPPFNYMWMEYTPLCRTNPKMKMNTVGMFINLVEPAKGKGPMMLATALFALNKNGVIFGPVECVLHILDEKGKISSVPGNSIAALSFGMDVSETSSAALPMYQALALLHCKNVSTVEKDIPTTINERHKQKHPPLVKFNTIHVRPAGKRFSQMALPGTPGDSETPYHICRGHFKTFDEKPLLGRTKGTFWWGSFARGDKKYGQIISDYKVADGNPE